MGRGAIAEYVAFNGFTCSIHVLNSCTRIVGVREGPSGCKATGAEQQAGRPNPHARALADES